MKRFIITLATILLMLPAVAQEKQLSALFGYSAFYLPEENRPYVETYLDFDAWSLQFQQQTDGKYQATVEVTIVVRKDDSIAFLKKYDLHSPAVADPKEVNFTFLDLQRFQLTNGIYTLELTVKDKMSSQAPFTMKDKLVVYFEKGKTTMSNIQLMGSAKPTVEANVLSRNGYDMVPYVDDIIPERITALYPYFELYNLRNEIGDSACLVHCYIERRETGRAVDGFHWASYYKSLDAIQPIFATLDIADLPNGNYNLVAEVRDKQNQQLMKRNISFQRYNPKAKLQEPEVTDEMVATSFAVLIKDEKQLNYYLDGISIIASPTEVDAIRALIPRQALDEKQAYFYRFWMTRDAIDPEGAWNKYHRLMEYADSHFGLPRTPGIHTDRGRVYLQYGPPDFIRDEKNFVGALNPNRNQTSEDLTLSSSIQPNLNGDGQGHIHYLPYQLWRYNILNGDPNRVFIFWDEFRGGLYKLLNSNARGELQTPFWERVLSRNQLDEYQVGEVGEQFNRGY